MNSSNTEVHLFDMNYLCMVYLIHKIVYNNEQMALNLAFTIKNNMGRADYIFNSYIEENQIAKRMFTQTNSSITNVKPNNMGADMSRYHVTWYDEDIKEQGFMAAKTEVFYTVAVAKAYIAGKLKREKFMVPSVLV